MNKEETEILHERNLFEGDYRPTILIKKKCLEKIISNITNALVLDIGASSGSFSKYLENINKVVSFDISLIAMKKASRKLANPKCVVGDALYLPFRDKTFNAVLMFDVIEHLNNRDEIVTEVARILRDGGTLAISAPEDMSLYCIIDKSMGHYIRYSKEELIETLKPSFTPVLLSDFGFPLMRFYYKNLLPKFHNKAIGETKDIQSSCIVKFACRIIAFLFHMDLLFKGNFKGVIIYGIFKKTIK
jgi:ubiquinone/menaquinone biosynthesis C-methylase UbiE